MRTHLSLAAMLLSLFAASLEAGEFAVGDTIDVALPDGQASLALTITSESQGFGGMRVYSARIGNGPVASSVLVSGEEIYIEARDLDAGVLHKVSIRNGETHVESIDLSKTRHGECIEVDTPVEMEEPSKAVRTRLMASNPFDDVVVAPAPVTIDMMLVFENGARDWIAAQSAYGGSITNFAVMQIAKMNQVLENTGLHTNFWFRLVDIMSVDTRVTRIAQATTKEMKDGADSGEGPYGEVKTRRDACGADCVSLIVDTGSDYGTTGIGYTTKGTNPEYWATAFREWCYSVCAVRAVANSYTLSHEVGHNMGLGHSKTLNNWEQATYSYANGYNFRDSSNRKYHTVMAYDYDHSGNTTVYGYVEIPYFSSPAHTLSDGTPVGSETANATLALRNTCPYIARWRDTKIPMPSDVLFSVAPTETFIQPLEVALSTVGNFPIHYTLDGTTPTPDSPLYTEPLTFTTSATVKAVAVVDGNNTTGAVFAASYSPAVPAEHYLKLASPSGSWKNGDWRDESGGSFTGSQFFNATDKIAFLMPGCDIDVDTQVNLGTLVLVGETPIKVTTSRSLAAATLDVVGNVTLSGLSYAFPIWKLHPGSSLVLSPGANQTLAYTNNISLSDASASFVVSNGTVSVNTAGSNYGCFGDATLRVACGGTLVIAGNGWKTGYQNSSPFIIYSNATMRVKSTESIHRPLTLAGGVIDIDSNGRMVDFNGLSIAVTDNSEIKATNPSGYVVIRNSDASIDVASAKTLLVSAEIRDGGSGLQSNGRGIVKSGAGTLRFTTEPNHSGATTINAGTLSVGFSSSSAVGTGWSVASGAKLRIEDGCSLSVPSLSLARGAALEVPASAGTAPVTATNSVNVSEVLIVVNGVSDLSEGARYPVIAAPAFMGAYSADVSALPAPAEGLKWHMAVEDGVIYAMVSAEGDIAKPMTIPSNCELSAETPSDARASADGGIIVSSLPIMADGLSTKRASFSVDVTIPENPPSDLATLCSWKVGKNVIYCVRKGDGYVDCYYGNGSHVNNATNSVLLTSGRHKIEVGYWSEASPSGGTWVWVDREIAYFNSGLKWKSDSVSRVAFGATAADTPAVPFPGLVIHGVGAMDLASSAPMPGATSSGGDLTYKYYYPTNVPSVFPNTGAGGYATRSAYVEAPISGMHDAISVSVAAAFPADATGTICGIWLKKPDTSSGYTAQAEYLGGGVFAIRYMGFSLSGYPDEKVEAADPSVEKPHVYTLTFSDEQGARLFQDGVELAKQRTYLAGKGYKAYYRATFGCGPWTKWTTSWNENPNPMPYMNIYASHVALGTDDRKVSERQVRKSFRAHSASVGSLPAPGMTMNLR